MEHLCRGVASLHLAEGEHQDHAVPCCVQQRHLVAVISNGRVMDGQAIVLSLAGCGSRWLSQIWIKTAASPTLYSL